MASAWRLYFSASATALLAAWSSLSRPSRSAPQLQVVGLDLPQLGPAEVLADHPAKGTEKQDSQAAEHDDGKTAMRRCAAPELGNVRQGEARQVREEVVRGANQSGDDPDEDQQAEQPPKQASHRR